MTLSLYLQRYLIGLSNNYKFWSNIQFNSARRLSELVELKLNHEWESVVGLEIHAQISSQTKLFSRSGTSYGQPVNSQVSIFDCALPGTLPRINYQCVESAVLTSLALNCTVNKISNFDRKHYFYADLPAGYQITQHQNPISRDGSLTYSVYSPTIAKNVLTKSVTILQLQLEQDSGKSVHDELCYTSFIDLNRAGIGLMEIITAPDFVNGLDAAMFIKELQLMLQTLGTCDGKMSEGSMRIDANISVNAPGAKLGTRTEVKNINSLRNVAKAIDFEIVRQIEILEQGGHIVNETRSFNSETEETVSMREKENRQDYRFMPEPNLPPLVLYTDSDIALESCLDPSQIINIDTLRLSLPELPETRRDRMQKMYQMSQINSCIIVSEPILADIFEETVNFSTFKNNKYILNFLLNNFMGILNSLDISLNALTISAKDLAIICDLVQDGVISHNIATKVLEELINNPEESITSIIKINQWEHTVDHDDIVQTCSMVLNTNTQTVNEYLNGQTKVFNFFVGQARKDLHETADPKIIAKVLKKMLAEKTLKNT